MPAASASLMTWTGRPRRCADARRGVEVDPALVDVGGGLHGPCLMAPGRPQPMGTSASGGRSARTRATTMAIVSSDGLRRGGLGRLLAHARGDELRRGEVHEGGLDAGAAHVDAERQARQRDGCRAQRRRRSACRGSARWACSSAAGYAPHASPRRAASRTSWLRLGLRCPDDVRPLRRLQAPAPRPRPRRDQRLDRLARRARPRRSAGARPVRPLQAAQARPPAPHRPAAADPDALHQHHQPGAGGRPSPATRRWSCASGAWCAGTPRPWSCAPTWPRRASAATWPPTPPRPASTRSASTTSSAARTPTGMGDQVFFQGHAAPGHLRPRLPRGSPERSRSSTTSGARSCPARASRSYPHPRLMPDFWEFPTVSMGLVAAGRHLPGALQPLPPPPRHQGHLAQPRLGLPRRRRDGRAGVAGLALHRRARGAGQPGLRRQLQPAASRRPGARQRQDHPGAGGRLPRRRLERHQGHLGPRVGRACWRATPTACSSQRMADVARRRVAEVLRGARLLHARALLRRRPAPGGPGRRQDGRRDQGPPSRRARLPQALRRLPRGQPAERRAHGHPGPDRQGLDAGLQRGGPQHHPPGQEAQRAGAARLPRPPGAAHPRRDSSRTRPTTTPGPTRRRSSTCRSAARRWAAPRRAASCCRRR